MPKFQEAGSILRVGFALSKCPHFDSVYLLDWPFALLLIVNFLFKILSVHCAYILIESVSFGLMGKEFHKCVYSTMNTHHLFAVIGLIITVVHVLS